jgi:hypothetical protein
MRAQASPVADDEREDGREDGQEQGAERRDKAGRELRRRPAREQDPRPIWPPIQARKKSKAMLTRREEAEGQHPEGRLSSFRTV